MTMTTPASQLTQLPMEMGNPRFNGLPDRRGSNPVLNCYPTSCLRFRPKLLKHIPHLISPFKLGGEPNGIRRLAQWIAPVR
jgi:hypothetical protein